LPYKTKAQNENAVIKRRNAMRPVMKSFIILFVLTAWLAAGQKRAITFQDFFSMKRMSSVTVNPNGDLVAFCLTTPNIDANKFKTDIFIYSLKDNTLSPLTQDEKSSTHPVWAPDGKTLYFNRDGQIWKIALDGGEAVQVTHFVAGASDVVIAPGNDKLLFVSEVYPECPTIECIKQKMDSVKNSKVKARIIDHLFYRHWNRWLNGKRSHVFMADMQGNVLKDVTPGDYDTPPLDLGGQHDYVFSPDGKEICFVRNTDPMVAASTNNDLFIYNIESGKITRLTTNKGDDCNPTYSPDGRYLAYLSMETPGFEADRRRIMLYDRKTGKTVELTKGFTLSVGSVFWHPDKKEIYFTCGERGTVSIYKVNIRKPHIVPVLKGHTVADVQFANGNTLIFREQNEAMPYELFKFDLKKHRRTQLTFVNKALLDQLELPRLEPFAFVGAHGDSVHGYIMRPPFFEKGKKYPAIELIHGGPQGAWEREFHYRWNYQMFAAPGYVIFMINFHGSSGYGQAFTNAVSKDWGGAPYQDILIGTKYVLDHYKCIDPNRVGAAGASYGGFMINWIEGGEQQPFKCLVSHDGVFEQVSMYGATEELWFPEHEFNGTPWDPGSLYQKWNPAAPERVRRFKTPMLVVHGEHDYRVPYTQGLQIFTALQRQGIKSKLLFFPDEYHFVVKPQNARLWWKTVHQWFADFLQN
jgi:dipeptidyl aminopeptidase/acylaminoacyl peptidase